MRQRPVQIEEPEGEVGFGVIYGTNNSENKCFSFSVTIDIIFLLQVL